MSASVYSHGKAGSVSGKRMCKTKVKVLGRFLLSPEEEFNATVAKQLIDKAKGRQLSIGTVLRVFEMGVQLGDTATLAAMPVEFIKYHRLSDMIVLTNESTILSICIKDYDQRTIILVQFKDKVSLKVVADVVQKRRNALLESFARMQPTYDQGASMRRQVSSTAAGNQIEASNPVANDATLDHTDGNGEPQIDSHEQGITDSRVNDSAPQTQATGVGVHEDSNHDMLHRRQLGELELQLQTSRQPPLQDPQSLSVRNQVHVGQGMEENHRDSMAGQSHSFQPPQQQRPSNALQDHQAADRHQYTDDEIPNPLRSLEQPLSSGAGEHNYHDLDGTPVRQKSKDRPLNQVQAPQPQHAFALSNGNHNYHDVNGVNVASGRQIPPQQSLLSTVEHQLYHGSNGHQTSERGPLQVDIQQPLPQQSGTTKLPRHDYHSFLAHHDTSTETAVGRAMSLQAGRNSQHMSNDASQQFDRRLPRTPVDNTGEFRNRHFSGYVRPIARVTDTANLSDFGNGWWADQGYYYRRNRIFMTAKQS